MNKCQVAIVACACLMAPPARAEAGLSAPDASEAAVKPDLITALEAITNAPCVDKTTDKPYGFPLTEECPFSVSREVLDKAVGMARSASKANIISARVGHMSHPMWAPGVSFCYDSYRTNQHSVTPFLIIHFNDATETREEKASCGRGLIRISAASLGARFGEQTNEVFVVGDAEVDLNIRCTKTTVTTNNTISISDVQLNSEVRAAIQGFLQDVNDGKYLYPARPGELKSLAGKVFPGEAEKDLIPEAMAKTAFAKVDLDDDEIQFYQDRDDDLTYGSTLQRGRAMDLYSLEKCRLEYDTSKGWIQLCWSNGKYSASYAEYCKVDGIWIKSPVGSIHY